MRIEKNNNQPPKQIPKGFTLRENPKGIYELMHKKSDEKFYWIPWDVKQMADYTLLDVFLSKEITLGEFNAIKLIKKRGGCFVSQKLSTVMVDEGDKKIPYGTTDVTYYDACIICSNFSKEYGKQVKSCLLPIEAAAVIEKNMEYRELFNIPVKEGNYCSEWMFSKSYFFDKDKRLLNLSCKKHPCTENPFMDKKPDYTGEPLGCRAVIIF